jgi:hypothetical protein
LRVTEQDLGELPSQWSNRLRLEGDGFSYGADPDRPSIGDLRIRYEIVTPQIVSAVGGQSNGVLVTHRTRSGGGIALLQSGAHDAATLFDSAEAANRRMLWVLRFVGLLLASLGFQFLFRPLVVASDILPFTGRMVGFGVFLVSGLMGGLIVSVTIAIGWLFYRPIIGVGVLVIAAVFGWMLIRVFRRARRRKRAAAAMAEPVAPGAAGLVNGSPPPPPPT